MRFINGDREVNVVFGGARVYAVLEGLGYKSEWQIEAERKKEAALAKFREAAAKRWACPECGKEMSALARNKHHAYHQGGR